MANTNYGSAIKTMLFLYSGVLFMLTKRIIDCRQFLSENKMLGILRGAGFLRSSLGYYLSLTGKK